MIDRILDRFEPQRRHLAFLVGLLGLTFVLTVMLALQANRAEVARQQQAQGVLQDLVGRTAVDWAGRIEMKLGPAAVASLAGAVAPLTLDAGVSLDQLAEKFSPEEICPACDEPYGVLGYFSVEPGTGDFDAIGDLDMRSADAIGSAIMTMLDDIAHVPLNDRISMAVFFVDTEGLRAFMPALLRADADGSIIRVVGFAAPMAEIRDAFSIIFGMSPAVPPSMAKGLPNDSFFSVHAVSGGATIVDTAHDGNFVATDTVRAAPFKGVVLRVGIRENAATRLLIAGAVTSSVPLLLTLLFAICGVILLALVLVRREAELVRLRADFVSGVSHELRTPLAQIRMFTETLLLNRVRSDVERRRSLEIVDQEARRLTHLVENILLFSKAESGRRSPITPEPTDLAAEVRRAVESFGPLCRTRAINVRTELQDRIVVAVDRGALRQVMINLLDNALKYGPAGQRVTVGVALYDETARVWVDDEGPGIPAAAREKVFESFYRLQRDIESRSSGSGIGLAVVRQLARLHGGESWAEAAPGGGARIVVQFPDAYLRSEPSADFAAAS